MSIAQEIQRIQSAKANIKSAIEQKGVTVGDGTIDTYAAKISEISGGGSGDYEQGFEDGKNSVVDLGKLCSVIAFNNLNLFGKSEIVLNLDNVINLNNAFSPSVENITVEDITINCKNTFTGQNINGLFNCTSSFNDRKLKRIILNFDTSLCTHFNNLCYNRFALETIGGIPLDFTSAIQINQPFRNCTALKELRIKPNTIKINFGIQYTPNLSTDTIQSIIDGLATVDTAQTLTLHSTVGAKLTDAQKATITSKNWELVY